MKATTPAYVVAKLEARGSGLGAEAAPEWFDISGVVMEQVLAFYRGQCVLVLLFSAAPTLHPHPQHCQLKRVKRGYERVIAGH